MWTYAGVRPLYDDGASEAKAATREYVFELDTARRRAAAVDLWRQDHHPSAAGRRGAGTARALSAGRQGARRLDRQIAIARRRYGRLGDRGADGGIDARLSVPDAVRMPTGWRMPTAPAPARCSATRNRRPISASPLAPRLTESEVRYLMANEWACTAEDIVWRRSKLGLRLSADEIAALDDWMAAHRACARTLLCCEAGGRT